MNVARQAQTCNVDVLRRLLLLVLLVVATPMGNFASQYVRVADGEVHVTPSQEPEPSRRINGDPRDIFDKLTSTSELDRQVAARQLGWATSTSIMPSDARLFLVNLDSDEEAEVIIMVSGTPASTAAVVFDHQKGGWIQVGEFHYWWHWNANQAEKFIELREIVLSGTKDVLVRTQNGGTGVSETELAIYRMRNGRLYRVFRIVEEGYHTVCCGTPDTGAAIEETREVSFRENQELGSYILVRHRRMKQPPDSNSKLAKSQSRAVSCTAFKWVPGKFMFEADKAATSRNCGSK
jgi:hypothetical protein